MKSEGANIQVVNIRSLTNNSPGHSSFRNFNLRRMEQHNFNLPFQMRLLLVGLSFSSTILSPAMRDYDAGYL
jgi:hypothetical protein